MCTLHKLWELRLGSLWAALSETPSGSVPREVSSTWISEDCLAVLSGVPAEILRMETAAMGRTHHASSSRPGTSCRSM